MQKIKVKSEWAQNLKHNITKKKIFNYIRLESKKKEKKKLTTTPFKMQANKIQWYLQIFAFSFFLYIPNYLLFVAVFHEKFLNAKIASLSISLHRFPLLKLTISNTNALDTTARNIQNRNKKNEEKICEAQFFVYSVYMNLQCWLFFLWYRTLTLQNTKLYRVAYIFFFFHVYFS